MKMKKLYRKNDTIGLLPFKPLVSDIVKSVKHLDTLKKERDTQKKSILFLFNSVIASSKLTKDERKQVSDAMKLLIKKGI